jgi:exodeoxyribonuclease VII large subunit
VGHETDFTIADFVADLRAPTPTAAAELVAMPTQVWLDEVKRLDGRLQEALTRRTDREAQRLDQVTARMGRPSQLAHRSRMHLASLEQGLSHAMQIRLRTCRSTLESIGGAVPRTMQRTLEIEREQLARAALRLGALDPSLVLRRGYAWLADGKNRPITSITQTQVGQQVVATLADGAVDMTVQHRHAN